MEYTSITIFSENQLESYSFCFFYFCKTFLIQEQYVSNCINLGIKVTQVKLSRHLKDILPTQVLFRRHKDTKTGIALSF